MKKEPWHEISPVITLNDEGTTTRTHSYITRHTKENEACRTLNLCDFLNIYIPKCSVRRIFSASWNRRKGVAAPSGWGCSWRETAAFKVKSTPPHRLWEAEGVGYVRSGGGLEPAAGHIEPSGVPPPHSKSSTYAYVRSFKHLSRNTKDQNQKASIREEHVLFMAPGAASLNVVLKKKSAYCMYPNFWLVLYYRVSLHDKFC